MESGRKWGTVASAGAACEEPLRCRSLGRATIPSQAPAGHPDERDAGCRSIPLGKTRRYGVSLPEPMAKRAEVIAALKAT